MLRIFTSVKIQRLRPGLNPRPWMPEASMLTTIIFSKFLSFCVKISEDGVNDAETCWRNVRTHSDESNILLLV
jgi:hypothetical protein